VAGAPLGNSNYTNGRIWKEAILRALKKRSRGDRIEALDELAETLLRACDKGDIPALRELGDRLEGKATQSIVGGEGPPISVEMVRRVVMQRPNDA